MKRKLSKRQMEKLRGSPEKFKTTIDNLRQSIENLEQEKKEKDKMGNENVKKLDLKYREIERIYDSNIRIARLLP